MAARNAPGARTARKVEAQAKALELRRAGRSYSEIAAALGASKGFAHKLVHQGLADAREAIAGSADALRAEEASRLDALLTATWPDARRGNLSAVDRVLKIMERRAKLLGLDAPERREIGGPHGAPIPVAGVAMTRDEFAALALDVSRRI